MATKFDQDVWQDGRRPGHARPQPQSAETARAERRDLFTGQASSLPHRGAIAIEGISGLGRHNAPRLPLEQLGAQVILELANAHAERRLRYAEKL